MKTFLVICTLLIGFACYASGPVLKDCDAVSATVSQTIDPVQPAYILEAVVFYDLPFAGIIPELGMPLQSAKLTAYSADIWHPPVINSTSRLKTKMNIENSRSVLEIRARSSLTCWKIKTNLTEVFHICWFDIA